MAKIQRLSEHLMNMISAGEVVERPSGIVKELIENSIDAKATEIEVTIRDGGITFLQVRDNGSGMDAEDATMAFERHATSKLRNENELFAIQTMGFRGEALPSIASVSEVTLKTNDGNDSTEVKIQYGKLIEAKPMYCPEGTEITVENLFQKTPARLKHLRSRQYETAIVSSIVEKYALGYPGIAFSLVADGKELLSFNGSNQLEEVMTNVYGREVIRNVVLFENEDYDFRISGAYVLPNVTRASNNYITLFVNHRLIRHYRINKVIMEAFSDYLFNERYPIVVLNVESDAHLVDVNVHPTKWEIRLSKEQQLEDLIRKTLLDSLHKSMNAPEVRFPVQKEKVEFANFNFDEPVKQPASVPNTVQEAEKEEKYVSEYKTENVTASVEKTEAEARKEENKEEPKVQNYANGLPVMTVIGQLHGNYILAEAESGLYIIDQHAAQERYNYELFQKRFMEKEVEYQPLLLPFIKEVGTSVVNSFNDFEKMCQNLQLHVELFGSDSIVLREIPTWMHNIDLDIYLSDLVDIFKNERKADLLIIRDHALESLACHASVKFNTRLTMEEMRTILNHMQQCVNPYKCPHGRPTFIHISRQQLIKEFLR